MLTLRRIGEKQMTLTELLETHRQRCTGTPDLRLVEENEQFRDFVCLTCGEPWRITRSKLKRWAREENRLERYRKLGDAERSRISIFGRLYAGTRHS